MLAGETIIFFIIITIFLAFRISFGFKKGIFKELTRDMSFSSPKNKLTPANIKKEIDTLGISIEQVSVNRVSFLGFELDYQSTIPGDIYISKENFRDKFNHLVGKQDIQTGDPDFDDEMSLLATPLYLIPALMDEKTRRLILRLVDRGQQIEITQIKVKCLIKKTLFPDMDEWKEIVDLLRSISSKLARKRTLAYRFAENILKDPLEEVRINNIKALTQFAPNAADTLETLRQALSDPCARVRIEAAKYLGDEGCAHLATMIARDRENLETLRLIEIIEGLNQKQPAKYLELLKELYGMQRIDINPLRMMILEHYKKKGNESLQSFLLEQLGKERGDLDVYIIEALGTCGTVESVEKLLEYSDSTWDREIRRTTKEAVAAIQARLGNVEKGWLTIPKTGKSAGGLSITNNAGAGALSQSNPNNPSEKENEDESPIPGNRSGNNQHSGSPLE